jgi:hypothetical protein
MFCVEGGASMNNTVKKDPRETARYYRSLGLICRQQAARHPQASWKWLSEAERWEDMAVRVRDTVKGPAIGQPSNMQSLPDLQKSQRRTRSA